MIALPGAGCEGASTEQLLCVRSTSTTSTTSSSTSTSIGPLSGPTERDSIAKGRADIDPFEKDAAAAAAGAGAGAGASALSADAHGLDDRLQQPQVLPFPHAVSRLPRGVVQLLGIAPDHWSYHAGALHTNIPYTLRQGQQLAAARSRGQEH
jgi:hypothetical protein